MISRRRGLVELVVAGVLFGVMAYGAKLASAELDGAETAFIRFAVGLAVVLIHFVRRGRRIRIRRFDLLAMRGIFGGAAVLMYFLAIAHLPVGTATLLNYSAPIFTTTFAAIFLGETLVRRNVAAMTVAGLGVLLVVYGQGRDLGGAYFWQALGLLSAIASGAAVTAIRAARKTDGAWEVFGALCLLGLLPTGIFALPVWRPLSPSLWLLLIGIGIVAAAAQLLMTHALAAVDAATAGVISQLTVVTALFLGHTFDDEPFGPVSAVGALLTVLGVTIVSVSTRERDRMLMRLRP